ncbi:hypothetical protein FHS27_005061 [Rhodopirellula rubra]|uniref:Uncharacterized protein n=1 Tax=Aporhodopirellula rubra TaxID=980271 RepID=A0A7W5E336_9BACT|nr:hypothetical protein [Aporhodopirellula rubra]
MAMQLLFLRYAGLRSGEGTKLSLSYVLGRFAVLRTLARAVTTLQVVFYRPIRFVSGQYRYRVLAKSPISYRVLELWHVKCKVVFPR